jgi:fumarate hydratase class II
MVCAQVIGNHTAITVAGQSGNFQLNVMLPLIAHDLLQSIALLAAAMTLAGRCGDRRVHGQARPHRRRRWHATRSSSPRSIR